MNCLRRRILSTSRGIHSVEDVITEKHQLSRLFEISSPFLHGVACRADDQREIPHRHPAAAAAASSFWVPSSKREICRL